MYGPGGGRWKVRVGGDDGTFDAKYLKYSTVRYIIVRYSIVQYSTVLYSTLQYNTVYIGPYSSKFMIDTTHHGPKTWKILTKVSKFGIMLYSSIFE